MPSQRIADILARSAQTGDWTFQMLNIKVVNKKSNPKTASDATTTVRVVARDTPSGVGWDSKPWYSATKVTVTPRQNF